MSGFWAKFVDPEELLVALKDVSDENLDEFLHNPAQNLQTLFTNFGPIPKAKTAKIVRSLVETASAADPSLQIKFCRECVDWCTEEKRTFLRQRIQTRLAQLLLDTKQYHDASSLVAALTREVKRFDDKLLLVELYMIESHIHHALRNIPRARAAMTSARTASNSTYVGAQLLSSIDLQAGTLLIEDGEFKTAYSYLFESFEGYSTLDHPLALKSFKYMLLCKIMVNSPGEVGSLLLSKAALPHAGAELDAMRAIAAAAKEKSLQQFEACLERFRGEVYGDELLSRQVKALYGRMLEQNLLKLVTPFSRVELEHLAKLIRLPVKQVEIKLSQMILDNKLHGTLDQGKGLLVVFDESAEDELYAAGQETLQNMDKVVDALYARSRELKY